MRICLTVTLIWVLSLSLDVATWALFFREHVRSACVYIYAFICACLCRYFPKSYVRTARPTLITPHTQTKQIPPNWVSMVRIVALRSIGLIDAIILGNLFGVRCVGLRYLRAM